MVGLFCFQKIFRATPPAPWENASFFRQCYNTDIIIKPDHKTGGKK